MAEIDDTELALLKPLADQLKSFALGVAKSQLSEAAIRERPDEFWPRMAAHVRDHMAERGVVMVRAQ